MTVVPEATLKGALVRLRPRTYDDIPLFVEWYSDPEVRHWLHMSETPEPTFESERMRYEMSERDPSRMTWVIETLDGLPIGNVSLVAIDDTHERAELGIGIGAHGNWDRSYGTDAIRVLLRFCFESMGLRRVTLITDADNARGIRRHCRNVHFQAHNSDR